MQKIVVVGSLNMDCVIDTPSIPKGGETIAGESINYIPGGKGANQAYAAGKLGGDVDMIGAVGDDSQGAALMENLKSVGVNIDGISVVDGETTGQAFIAVDEEGENAILIIAGANGLVDKELIDANIHHIEEADIVVMQFEIPVEVVEYVKNLAVRMGKLVIIDPAPAVQDIKDEFWSNVDYIKPNITELEVLTGQDIKSENDLKTAAHMMLNKGVKNVIVTLGGKGCLMVTGDRETFFPANKVKAVDTTAAGDCFTAAFAVAISEGKSPDEAIEMGQKASAIAVTRKGAQTSIPGRNEF